MDAVFRYWMQKLVISGWAGLAWAGLAGWLSWAGWAGLGWGAGLGWLTAGLAGRLGWAGWARLAG